MPSFSDKIIVNENISSKILMDNFEGEHGDGYLTTGYPDVKNRKKFIQGFTEFFKRIAKKRNISIPNQIRLHVIEDTPQHNSQRLARYMIVLNDDSEPLAQSKDYSVVMVYKPTMEAEAISVISEDEITWSADSIDTTTHQDRTSYYVGFLILMSKKVPGYDKEQSSDKQLTPEELMQTGISGMLPAELIQIEDTDELLGLQGGDESIVEEDIDGSIKTEIVDDDQVDSFAEGKKESQQPSKKSRNKKKQKQPEEESLVIDDLEVEIDDLWV